MTDRRTQLLDAARAAFVQHGFERTPVSAIVKQAGVAQGTFYLYFKSKADLVTELRREVVRAYEAALVDILARPLPLEERFARIVAAMAVLVGRHIELERMFRASGSGEDSLRAAQEGRQRLARHTRTLLADLPEDEAQATAALIVTLFDALLFDAHAFAPDTVPTVVRTSLRFCLRGLAVPEDRIDAQLLRLPDHLAEAEAR